MVKGEQPRVIVVANEFNPTWERELNRIGVDVFTLQIFKSDREHYVFETDLAISPLPETTLTFCRRDRTIQSWLHVNSPAALPISVNEKLEIIIDGAKTFWTRV